MVSKVDRMVVVVVILRRPDVETALKVFHLSCSMLTTLLHCTVVLTIASKGRHRATRVAFLMSFEPFTGLQNSISRLKISGW